MCDIQHATEPAKFSARAIKAPGSWGRPRWILAFYQDHF